MEKKILFVLLFVLMFFQTQGQWTQTSGPEGANAQEIVQIGTDLIVSTNTGGLYKSSDGGTTWNTANKGLPNNPYVRRLIKSESALYASTLGGLHKSVDAGENWVELDLGNLGSSFSAIFVNGDHIFAGNSNGGITYSNDAGITWQYTGGNVANNQIEDFAMLNSKVYATGSSLSGTGPTFFESSDLGATWQPVEVEGVGPNGFSSLLAADGNLYGGGQGKLFVLYANSGTWVESSLSSNSTIGSIRNYENRIYVNAASGKFYYSADEGLTWNLITNPETNGHVRDVFVDSGKIIMSTGRGLFRSLDAGVTWSPSMRGIKSVIVTSLYGNGSYLMAGSARQGFFLSPDNGSTWIPKNKGLDDFNSLTIKEILDINGVFYLVTGSGIYSSNDIGDSWQRILNLGTNRSTDVLAYTNGTIISGSGASIWVSVDSGLSWIEKPISVLERPTSFEHLWAHDGTLLLSTVEGDVLRSTDLGDTWEVVSIGNEPVVVYNLKLFEGKLYAATSRAVFVSEDLGENWTRLNNSFLGAEDIIVTPKGVVAASGGSLWVTREDLNIWYPMNDSPDGYAIVELELRDDTIYAGTYSAGVWKLPLSHALDVLPEPPTSIAGFTLVNAQTDEDILELSEGGQINLMEYPGVEFNIRANTSGIVGSVAMQLTGPLARTSTESVAPYALFGDFPVGDYYGEMLPVGTYSIMGTPYSEASAGGTAGEAIGFNFQVVNEPLPPPFITTWKTDNLGSSGDNQITIPTFAGETYDYRVDWGDGTSDTGVTGDITHTYSNPGTYEVSISGDFPRIFFNDLNGGNGDSNKLVTIEQWGSQVWSSMEYAFAGCENLNVTAIDRPDLTQTSSMGHMFAKCSSLVGNESFANWDTEMVENMLALFLGAAQFNQDLSKWNVAKVENMGTMFADAVSFNQDIGGWDVGQVKIMRFMFASAIVFDQNLGSWNVQNVEDFDFMFIGAKLSTENYDKLLEGWVALPSLNRGLHFNAGDSEFCNATPARFELNRTYGWQVDDGGKAEDCEEPKPFITTWKTDNPGVSADNQITIPTVEGEVYNYSVDWGDGTSDSGVKGDITHTYANPGTYQVSITGVFPAILFGKSFPLETDDEKILSIDQWGDIRWSSMNKAFEGCRNMDVLAIDVPNLSEVEQISRMFVHSGVKGNASFDEWDTSNIIDMSGIFILTTFNQDISSWDVSKVVDMSSMFALNISFNQDISNWDVSNVENMAGMFVEARSFNQPIGSWKVDKVVNMNEMFSDASSFNQDITSWDVSSLETANGMFEAQTIFDQNIGSWNISNVKELARMFNGAAISRENYDGILQGWSTQTLQNGVEFGADLSQFCSAGAARQKLIDEFGWTITDGGIAADCDFCPTTQITLTTQQQVDDFAVTYDIANCAFEGGIAIEGADIVNLDGLSGLTAIGGILKIVDTKITHMDGLMGLANVQGLTSIENNAFLTNLDGLSSTTFFSSLRIINNDVLANIDGLSSLDRVGRFTISDNAALTNIDGLMALTHVSGDLIIQNNESLENLNGLSPLRSVADDLVIQNNTLITDLDGLSSLVLIDNSLIIVSNPALSNVDGLMNLDGIGQALRIQSNPSLTNLDGLSSIVYANSDVDIVGNDALTNVNGLADLIFVGGDLNIGANITLSECAVQAVCDSDTVVLGSVTISGNTGNCADIVAARAACLQDVMVNANLLEATYLEGTKNPMPTGSLLRVEAGNRETYLKFDLSDVEGTITEARLEMQVSSDPGNGIVEVFLGSNSNWTETGLNGSNKPVVVGDALATISGTHAVGQTKTWNLDIASLRPGEELTLIVKHRNGNDVAFASDETIQAPKLSVSYTTAPPVQRPFITIWKTDNPGSTGDNQINIPTFRGEAYNYTVEWGDGTSDSGITGDATHSYAEPGTYTVSISGIFPRLVFGGPEPGRGGDRSKLLTVQQWGDIAWSSMEAAFEGCINLDVIATDTPVLSNVNSTRLMFASCRTMVGNSTFNDWDVSAVVDMSYMFSAAQMFNQPLGQWDTSNVVNMEETFALSPFNSDISDWDTSKVTNMQEMFEVSFFNQDISGWDVSQVENMHEMFQNSKFNRDISNWDVSSVVDMFGMFDGAKDFNQDLSAWNIGSVKQMGRLFERTNLSNEFYDRMLISWSDLQGIQSNVEWVASANQYCLGEAARQKLIDEFGWTIIDGGKAEDCVLIVEGEADLMHATYLEGANNPKPNGPLLRVEQGIRETYLKFDLRDFSGTVTEARLEMQVASDPGNGILEVFLGSNSSWTETGLNGSNKPVAVGSALASVTGVHSVGQTKTWNLNIASLSVGGELTLIVKHRNGNDVAFASDETVNAPRLVVTTNAVNTLGAGGQLNGVLSLSPNPAINQVKVSFESPEGVQLVNDIEVYDAVGRLVRTVSAKEANIDGAFEISVRSLESGIYFIRSIDEKGVPYQKQMAIQR